MPCRVLMSTLSLTPKREADDGPKAQDFYACVFNNFQHDPGIALQNLGNLGCIVPFVFPHGPFIEPEPSSEPVE